MLRYRDVKVSKFGEGLETQEDGEKLKKGELYTWLKICYYNEHVNCRFLFDR